MVDHLTNALILIGVIGIGAQWLAWRFRIPGIVLLVFAGLALGPGLGVVSPSRDLGGVLEPLISLFVAVILFEGGLNLRLHEFKQAGRGLGRLVLLGVPVAWLMAAAASHYIGGLSWPVSLVFGAITVITGPTVVLPLMRQARLKRRPAAYLKWEGIANDPLGALLVVLVYDYYSYSGHGAPFAEVIVGLVQAVAISGSLGWASGYLLGLAFRRHVVPEYLKSPMLLVSALLVFGLSEEVQHESGLLATTVMGVVLGNMKLRDIEEIRRFKEYITVMLVSGLFIVLTADLDPSILERLDWRLAALVAVILLAVRPLAILLVTFRSQMFLQERIFVGWVAPRGIVAAAMAGVLGPRMANAGYSEADVILPLVFLLIVASVLLHGFTLGTVARWLGLAAHRANGVLMVGASDWSLALARVFRDLDVPVVLADSSWQRLERARQEGIPVHQGEVLAESRNESLDTFELEYVLAATPNDAYNALVSTHLAPEFERARVIQLATAHSADDDPQALSAAIKGMELMHAGMMFAEIQRKFSSGWQFSPIKLDDDLAEERYRRLLAQGALNVAVMKAKGELQFSTRERDYEAEAGDTVVIFAPPDTGAQGPAAD